MVTSKYSTSIIWNVLPPLKRGGSISIKCRHADKNVRNAYLTTNLGVQVTCKLCPICVLCWSRIFLIFLVSFRMGRDKICLLRLISKIQRSCTS